jgi:anti-sigma regulatory factor (Ser/Thr protein kinase)
MPYYRCPACGLTAHSVAGYSTIGVCASCEAPLPADWKLDPAPQADWVQVVRSGIAAPAQARRMATALPLREEARHRLVIVVSELVTNSVRHSGVAAGGPIDIRVTEASGRLSVSVHDGGAGFSQPTAVNSSRRNGARGLRIVSALSENWSVETGPDGCTVRSELDVSSTALAPAQGGASRLAEGVAR